MATKGGPRLFNNLDHNDMVWYMDITNKDCWDGSAISSTSKLYNLANSSEYFYPQDSTYSTSTHYSLSRDYIERHNLLLRPNVKTIDKPCYNLSGARRSRLG